MRQLFISYARENKPDVEALVRDLEALGYPTWVDSSLQGGQTWWEEILRRIGNCDVFVAIVSGHTLSSVACKRELEWALAMNKPVLPLAVERLPDALPRTLSMRQIVNYSRSERKAALALAGALGTLPAAPPPPEQLPEPPPAPLSYLSDLVEQAGQPEPLTHQQQRQILIQLQPALRSADSEERRGGRYVLDMFSRRDDLYADVDRSVAQLGLLDPDAQRPVAPEATEDSHGEHALTAPEAAAEAHGNLLADPQWVDALNAYFAKRWVDAVDRFEALQGRYPGEHRVETRLTEARRQRDIDAWSSKAESAVVDGDWDTVVTALENLTGLDPNYPDVAVRLEQARIAQRRKALMDEMTALHQAGRWQAVVAAAEELARLDPDHPDPGGIVSDAQAKIREADLADRYAQALNHLDQEDWQQAADLFTAIEQEQPGYRQAAALLMTAQGKRDLAALSDQAEVAAGHDDWDTALTALEKICAVDPTFQDAGTRLEHARSANRLRTLVVEVTALHQTGRWKDVLSAAEELAQLDPDNPDPGGMVSDARLKVREAELADRHEQGVSHLKQQHWAQAVEVFGAIEQEQPGYRDATALLSTAQQSLAAAEEAEANKATTIPEDSPEAAAATSLSTETASPEGRSNAQESKLPPSMQNLTAVEIPTDTTSTPRDVPFFRRRNRRTQVVLAVGLVFAVMVTAVVIIVANQSSTGGGVASPTSTTEVASPTSTTAVTSLSAADATQRLNALSMGDYCPPASEWTGPPQDIPGVVASVSCDTDAPGDIIYQLYIFADHAALDKALNSPGGVVQPCPGRGPSVEDWHRAATPQQIEGKVQCVLAGKLPWVVWSISSQLAIGTAEGNEDAGFGPVYQWWTNRYQV